MTRVPSRPVRRALAAGAALPLALGLGACGGEAGAQGGAGAATTTVTHAQGTTSVPADPDRVVVLDLAVLDTLDALGLGDRVVGVPKGSLPDFQSTYAADDVAGVGTLSEPDVEKIAALEPELILVAGRSAGSYAELADVAPTVDLTVSGSDFVKGVRNQSETIGRVFGKQHEVEEQLRALDARIEQVRAKAVNSAPALVLLTSGGKVSAFGSGSRFGVLHDALGVPQAVDDLKQDRHGQAVSFEFIAKANPGRLFVIDRDAAIGQQGAAAKQVLDNALVRRTTAWAAGEVTYLDGKRWYVLGGGLRNLGAMVDAVGEAVGA